MNAILATLDDHNVEVFAFDDLGVDVVEYSTCGDEMNTNVVRLPWDLDVVRDWLGY
jgi:hypothetical protein